MNKTPRTVAAATLGCKVNTYDTESMLEMFRQAGYLMSDQNNADIVIINTCSVTSMADKKSRQTARRIISANPKAVIVLTGCYAQTNPDEAANIPGVHIVAGTGDRGRVFSLVENYLQKAMDDGIINAVKGYNIGSDLSEKTAFENLPVTGITGHTRAYIKIQDGCENFCSYCVIPYARGPVRSRKLSDIRAEAEAVAKAGVKEAIVSGISVASYGKDLGDVKLADAIRAVAQAGIPRIRLSSISPLAVDGDFLKVFESAQICPNVHLSLQSGSDATLKRMNRRYTSADYKRAVDEILSVKPDTGITADVISGFPGETEDDFSQSYSFIEGAGLAALHVFPYSRRPGTAAAGMTGQVSKADKERRAGKLLALGKRIRSGFLSSYMGSVQEVLLEREDGEGFFKGFTRNYIETSICPGDISECTLNTIRKVLITGISDDSVQGSLYI